jgi:hypothetical protein
LKSGSSSYRLYGLSLETPLSLPCPKASRRGLPDVSLGAGQRRGFESARASTNRGSAKRDWFNYRRLPDQSSYLRWSGLFEFLISRDGRSIRYNPLEHASAESFNTYLLGHVLSFSLLAFGEEPLHGTAIVADGKAIGFLGDCAAGKSTLGAAFISRGLKLLTDDVLVPAETEPGYEVHPGIPRIKLFPSVARGLLGRADGQRLNNGTLKQVLPLEAHQYCARKTPLAALYVLADERPDGNAITIEPLSTGTALLEVIGHTFNTIVTDRARLANQFTLASRLVSRVPIKRLGFARGLSRLPAVCDAVLKDALA